MWNIFRIAADKKLLILIACCLLLVLLRTSQNEVENYIGTLQKNIFVEHTVLVTKIKPFFLVVTYNGSLQDLISLIYWNSTVY